MVCHVTWMAQHTAGGWMRRWFVVMGAGLATEPARPAQDPASFVVVCTLARPTTSSTPFPHHDILARPLFSAALSLVH